MHQPSDEELFLRYRGDEGAALEALVRRYEQPLYSYLVRYLGDTHQAEDAFQETFLRLARAAGEFDTAREFRPWMYAIAANIARDVLRKRKVRRAASLDGAAEGSSADAKVEGEKQDADPAAMMPLDAAQRSEEASVLHEGIERLGADYRTAVRLHFFQGMKYREIAEALTIPLGTVKSRIHSALKQLETDLCERLGETEASEPWQETVKSTSG